MGASAGGLESFRDLLHNLPASPGLAIVYVSHLEPHHKSHLPEILGRVQRRQINPEALCRVDGSERRRQELHGEGPQQTRLAVAPATRGAGRAASQIPSGACPILRAGC